MAVPFIDTMLPGGVLGQSSARTPTMRGSLITFNYMFHKPGHDPAPLVLVTDIWAEYVRGINLHYLTFPAIRRLLLPKPGQSVCDSPSFTYQYIKTDAYIKSAFRQYKRTGMLRERKLDCSFIMNALSISRSFDPNEIEAIRQSVREQIRRMANPQAAPTGEMPVGQIPPNIR